MTYPAADVNTTNADASTDSPASARADILDLMQKFNQLRNHISTLWQTTLNRATAALVRTDLGSTTVGDAVFVAASAAAGRTALGAAASGTNADITSISTVTGLGNTTATAIQISTANAVGINKGTALRKLDVSGGAMTSAVTVAYSATPTIDASLSNLFVVGTLTGNITSITMSNAQEGQFLSIRLRQDATGSRTVAVPSGAAVSGSISATANKTSYLNLTYNATDARWEGNWVQIP
jgi:hypothetical protein